MENAKRVLRDETDGFVTRLRPRIHGPKDRAQTVEPSAANAAKGDWSKALYIIESVADALLAAETNARNADEYSQKLEAFHKDQMSSANDRAAAAERRAEALARQLEEAEGWLVKLSEALFSRFEHLDGQKYSAIA